MHNPRYDKATDAQKQKLKEAGIEISENTTQTQASDLIEAVIHSEDIKLWYEKTVNPSGSNKGKR